MTSAGKIDRSFFEKFISGATGAKRKDVPLGPSFGKDFGVVDLGGGRAMAVSTDPIWVDPAFGLARASWFAFHTLVGDVALSGLRPTHLALDWNLPAGLTRSNLRTIFGVFDTEAKKLGISVVTGHTGVYEGASLPTIGGGTAFALGRMKNIIWPGGSKRGDCIIITKGAAIETAVSLAFRFGDVIEATLGSRTAREIRSLFHTMSVVEDAIVASSVPGVTSMHDASERGVAAALNEMADTSGLRFVIEPDAIHVPESVQTLCSTFGLDPYSCSSEGALVVTVAKSHVQLLIDRLKSGGISAFAAGTVAGRGGGVFIGKVAEKRRLKTPETDHLLVGLGRAQEMRIISGLSGVDER